MMRTNYRDHGISFYFFTDDNFARKKLWRETFEEIIRLREEGLKVSFMMQVDLARKPKDFVALAAKAGCTQVFIGMESVNPENLKAEGKQQNNVAEYHNKTMLPNIVTSSRSGTMPASSSTPGTLLASLGIPKIRCRRTSSF